ncbi:MAG: M48 family metalloprotease [Rhodospirillales bacterium]|nr:M48 family metalloprotease [Rhodospirillales bacterium]MDE2199652.1 M48 family metalloprotease [Rhodospirillales bacterium]MDE2574074.1 M48 family metalloprotease [Rhodospirillales bacterium]
MAEPLIQPARRRDLLLLAASSLVRPVPAAAQVGGAAAGARLVIIRDAETETLLRNFANPLFRAAGVDPALVRIVILRDAAINSFVATGNRLFITTGLLMQARSALEVVGVLAHETGHIAGGHLARLPEAQRNALIESVAALLIGVAAGVASGNAAGFGAALGAQQMALRGYLSFTRGMEASADQAALTFLDRLHWSARGLLAMFDRLQNEEALLSDEQDPYLLTHPLTSARIAAVQDHVDHSPWSNAKLPAGFERRFAMVRAKLHGFLDSGAATLARIPAADATPPARYARAIALYRLGHTAPALALLDGLLRDDPSSPWLNELKGQILFDAGQVRAALVPYRTAIRLAPDQPLIRAALGRALIETGDRTLLPEAVQQLQTALDAARGDADTWRSLGTAWGRLGNIGQADLALAEEALLNGDVPAAHRLAGQAVARLPPGPARLRAQDIGNAVKRANREGF